MSDADRTLLVFEPQPNLAEFLASQIEGWRVESCVPGEPAGPGDAAIMAGPFDHAAVAVALRQRHMVGPLFSLADPGQDVAAPLVALPKPLRLNQLVSRLTEGTDSDIDMMPLGRWRLDMAQKSLVDRETGRTDRLTDRELALLGLLIRQAPAALTREDLQSRLWGYHSEATTHTVETHIWRLRQKLEDDPASPTHLLTASDGYRLDFGEPGPALARYD
jgi:hypothetical protein